MKSIAVLIVLLVASSGLCAAPEPNTKSPLNGTWAPQSAVMAGKAFPDEARKLIRLFLRNGTYAVNEANRIDEGTYTIDETKSPKTIKFVGTNGSNKGKTILGIYELDRGKGTLRICYDMSGEAYPAKFESKPDTQLFLATYHLQKRVLLRALR
jgi:uncharacterized protein (TIGR03067 family)